MNSLCFVPLTLFSIALGVFVFTYSNNRGIFSCVETLIYSADFLRVVVYNKLVKSVCESFQTQPQREARLDQNRHGV